MHRTIRIVAVIICVAVWYSLGVQLIGLIPK